ncbi:MULTISPECIES: hypothetical protein [Staphylococcus]|uniref:hypothetical protein n=1 Tax=Staphylococcus TaxID=1279 RepID=UPI000DF78C8F|nr:MULTISPECIES: hypothetical protein [unclassified Staphylococcus]UXV34222.1 hypothetical protein MUA90_09295 [Staphylococcus sp. IVB6181]
MNPRLERAYQQYIEKFGEKPPKPYLSTLSNYEKEEILLQRIRNNTPFSESKYYRKLNVQ